jgi:histidinol-phosphate aminotransferase
MVRAFLRSGEEAVIPHPSFVVYPMIVQAVGGIRVVVTLKDQRLDLEAMARAITPMTKMVFIANPNNPTATIVTADEVEHFMDRVPDKVIVVFDEAYIEFAQGPISPTRARLHSSRGARSRCPHLLEGGEPGRPAGGLRGSRSGLHRAAQPHPPAFQRQLGGPGPPRSALEDDSHVRECLSMIDAGATYLVQEFTALGWQSTPLARQLHPGRREPERERGSSTGSSRRA